MLINRNGKRHEADFHFQRKGAAQEMFEWDESKRLKVIEKHGIDLIRTALIFEVHHILVSAKSDVEQRYKAVGPLDGKLIAVIFTYRGDTIRLITARRARQDESRAYHTDVTG